MKKTYKRLAAIFAALLALLPLLFAGCAPRRYETTHIGYFNTVISISGYFATQREAEAEFSALLGDIARLHQLADAYNPYPGVANIYSLNQSAGSTVQVSKELMGLLALCKRMQGLTGCVNAGMGGVLSLWHAAREAALSGQPGAAPPAMEALEQAGKTSDMGQLQLDEAALTVRMPEGMRLDVGAIAKGWAADVALAAAAERGVASGLLLSMGGSVSILGSKPGGLWQVAVQDPFDPAATAKILAVEGGSVVTSGSYQRYFEVEGVRYCHIIDPVTLQPATRFESVTVHSPEPGSAALCDALSTALFILPLEEGRALAQSCGVQALWILPSGEQVGLP